VRNLAQPGMIGEHQTAAGKVVRDLLLNLGEIARPVVRDL
jgi:hypothetical protein